ncbi:MAG: succinate dehydrogenase, cytochrome b556 subunit [Pseudomonadota bacterium]|jgi:succinate dehydrogenase / fumarate reductase cytochrome b subunit
MANSNTNPPPDSNAQSSRQREFRNINAIVDLPQYRLPLAGLVSILHRISGFIMAALLPCMVWLLDGSLTSESSYDNLASICSAWYVKLIFLGIGWAFFHHLCAGIRHLIMDLHIGMTKEASKISAQCVFFASLVFTVLLAFKLFGSLLLTGVHQ